VTIKVKKLLVRCFESAKVLVSQLLVLLLSGIAAPNQRHIGIADIEQVVKSVAVAVVARQDRYPRMPEV
jgi:hypothetical protein